ncbi:MAG: hypothetical protein AB1480_05145 [Nitrospirota bacterium]
MKDIKIDRLEIRLCGISPRVALSTVSGLGNELLKNVSKEDGLFNQSSAVNISKIDSGKFQTRGYVSSSDLRKMIANRITESIVSKTK